MSKPVNYKTLQLPPPAAAERGTGNRTGARRILRAKKQRTKSSKNLAMVIPYTRYQERTGKESHIDFTGFPNDSLSKDVAAFQIRRPVHSAHRNDLEDTRKIRHMRLEFVGACMPSYPQIRLQRLKGSAHNRGAMS